jgi:hypothetical protein
MQQDNVAYALVLLVKELKIKGQLDAAGCELVASVLMEAKR